MKKNKLARPALAPYTKHHVYVKYGKWCERYGFPGRLERIWFVFYLRSLSCCNLTRDNDWNLKEAWGDFMAFFSVFIVYAVIISVGEEMIHIWCDALPWTWSIMSVMKWWMILSHFPSGEPKVSKFSKSILRKDWTDPRTFFSQLTIDAPTTTFYLFL